MSWWSFHPFHILQPSPTFPIVVNLSSLVNVLENLPFSQSGFCRWTCCCCYFCCCCCCCCRCLGAHKESFGAIRLFVAITSRCKYSKWRHTLSMVNKDKIRAHLQVFFLYIYIYIYSLLGLSIVALHVNTSENNFQILFGMRTAWIHTQIVGRASLILRQAKLWTVWTFGIITCRPPFTPPCLQAALTLNVELCIPSLRVISQDDWLSTSSTSGGMWNVIFGKPRLDLRIGIVGVIVISSVESLHSSKVNTVGLN